MGIAYVFVCVCFCVYAKANEQCSTIKVSPSKMFEWCMFHSRWLFNAKTKYFCINAFMLFNRDKPEMTRGCARCITEWSDERECMRERQREAECSIDQEDENKGIDHKHHSCLLLKLCVVKLHGKATTIWQNWNFIQIHQNTYLKPYMKRCLKCLCSYPLQGIFVPKENTSMKQSIYLMVSSLVRTTPSHLIWFFFDLLTEYRLKLLMPLSSRCIPKRRKKERKEYCISCMSFYSQSVKWY